MKNPFSSLALLCLLTLYSCTPNFNYSIIPPAGWTMYDTTMQGLKMRLIYAPDSLAADAPLVNVIVASMDGRRVDDFTHRNMAYLQENRAGIIILEKGSIDVSGIDARWFTYTKEQDGIVRDMINYIIPLKGFAYMITCGTKAGTMPAYRRTFDEIAMSFKG